jgi:Protein of unknown function (DUF1761)
MQNETKNTEIKNTALALLCAVTYSALPYVGSLLGCLIAAGASFYLMQLTQAQSLADYLQVGLAVGMGYGATITTVNAIAPNMRHPGLYAAVVGSYHLIGLVLCAAVLYGFS